MWDLIVSVPDHCLSFYFSMKELKISHYTFASQVFRRNHPHFQNLQNGTYLRHHFVNIEACIAESPVSHIPGSKLANIAYPFKVKRSNDQELIQSDPISCPQNQKGNN